MSGDLEIPSLVDASDIESWSDEVDVVVIGFGMAGGCAAVAAAAAGATVLVLERAATVGGTTALAGGHFYLGGLTTSVNGEVLRQDASPIAGLYAVGACASNLAIDGKSYASGTQLGGGSFFGRRAGAHAAAAARVPTLTP